MQFRTSSEIRCYNIFIVKRKEFFSRQKLTNVIFRYIDIHISV